MLKISRVVVEPSRGKYVAATDFSLSDVGAIVDYLVTQQTDCTATALPRNHSTTLGTTAGLPHGR